MDNPGLNVKVPLGFNGSSGSASLSDGKYKGIIKDVKFKKQISSGRDVVEYTIEVKQGGGTIARVKLAPDNDIDSVWFQNVLRDLGHKLIAGKTINLEKDIGSKVLVEIVNVKKNDRIYTNIIKMTKIETERMDEYVKAADKAKNESKPKSKANYDEDDEIDNDDKGSDETDSDADDDEQEEDDDY